MDPGALVLCGSHWRRPMAIWPQTKVGRRVRPGLHPSGHHPAGGHPGLGGSCHQRPLLRCDSFLHRMSSRRVDCSLPSSSQFWVKTAPLLSAPRYWLAPTLLPPWRIVSLQTNAPQSITFQLFPIGALAKKPQGQAGNLGNWEGTWRQPVRVHYGSSIGEYRRSVFTVLQSIHLSP